ncbi:hypothetical protein CNY89_27100, partial [Amaricoccus sp. HAR-UPW-R2A-40]
DGVVIRDNTVAYDSNQIVNQIPLIDVSPSSRNVDIGENTVYGVDAGHENATVFLVATRPSCRPRSETSGAGIRSCSRREPTPT